MFFEEICKEVKNKISDHEDFRIDVEKEGSLDIFYDGSEQLIKLVSKDKSSIIAIFKNVATSETDGQKILAVRDGEDLQTDFEEFTFIVNEQLGLLFTFEVSPDNKTHFTEDFISIVKIAFDGLNQASKAASAVEDETNEQQEDSRGKVHNVEGGTCRKPLEVVESCFKKEGWKYKRISGGRRIRIGFNLDNYTDSDSEQSITIIYKEVGNSDYFVDNGDYLRLEILNLYNIYKNRNNIEERYKCYTLASMACNGISLKYEAIKSWVDPKNGEVRLQLDIPLNGGAQLVEEQIKLITRLFVRVADDTYVDFMDNVIYEDSPENAWKGFAGTQEMTEEEKQLHEKASALRKLLDINVIKLVDESGDNLHARLKQLETAVTNLKDKQEQTQEARQLSELLNINTSYLVGKSDEESELWFEQLELAITNLKDKERETLHTRQLSELLNVNTSQSDNDWKRWLKNLKNAFKKLKREG